MKVIISPFCRLLREEICGKGKINPKNYPYWSTITELLKKDNIYTIQIGTTGEENINADEIILDKPLSEIAKLLQESDTWIAVDNFFNHFATYYKKRGVVIFSRSDPKIYGYDTNINLLKDRKYLRPDQFGLWESCEYIREAFVEPYEVYKSVLSIVVK